MADPMSAPMLAPSQGVHLVFDGSFLQGESAIMVPHTKDERVMFAIPWHGHTLVGTTDTEISDVSTEPIPLRREIAFILETAGQYLDHSPSFNDILSAWAGIRPLVRFSSKASTASLSRDHNINIDHNGLITIAGGKWTTYRRMAEDAINHASVLAGLEDRYCVTRHLRIHGYHHHAEQFENLSVYGSDAILIKDLIRNHPQLGVRLSDSMPYLEAEIIWAARNEMARTVDDILSRRTRVLQLNALEAIKMAPRVAKLLADELGNNDEWISQQTDQFQNLAKQYLP
jgi:glycerol-3-phosphate dehydrogenase